MSVEDGMYTLQYMGPDNDTPYSRVVKLGGSKNDDVFDFTGEEPTRADIARMAAGRRQVASDVAFGEDVIQLSQGTERYYEELAEEGRSWLQQQVDKAARRGDMDTMNPDEREVAELLGIKPTPVVIEFDIYAVRSGLGRVCYRKGKRCLVFPTGGAVSAWVAGGGLERLEELRQSKTQGDTSG